MKKLTEIQNELKCEKSHYNAFGKYKYRSCEDILEAVKPLLKKHDCTLTITDEVKEVGGLTFIEATATITEIHGQPNATSLEYISVSAQAGIDPNRKGMDIAQSFGSSSSYARKYALNGLFLIDDTKDADATNDHGKTQETKPQQAPVKPQPKPTVAKSATVPKAERIIVTEGDENFLKIVKGVSTGKATLQQALDKFNISEVVEASLKEKIQSLAEIV
jgi:hypothetical protein